MLQILHAEGFNIKERELMRVRTKNRWLLRQPNGMKGQAEQGVQMSPEAAETPTPTTPAIGMMNDQTAIAAATTTDHDTAQLLALQQDTYKQEDQDSLQHTAQSAVGNFQLQQPAAQEAVPEMPMQTQPSTLESPSVELPPEILAKRKERLEKLKADSDERYATKKRRRRTRGWAGLPADPPAPPRFPSETTIDESKQYLRLDNDTYRDVRDHFQRICEECGFIKKTIAGPEKWQAAKDRLVNECPHLQAVMWGTLIHTEEKALALDVLCTDVTKRMRTQERRMTIAEAKNALGVNPEESRQIRSAFYNILLADHFTSKLEAGDEHWNELKQRWIQESDLLQRVLAPGQTDPQHATKLRATEVLCRDVMKRLRDDQAKRDPDRNRAGKATGSGATRNTPSNRKDRTYSIPAAAFHNGISTLASQALASAPMVAGDLSDMQIDPSLLQAAANDPAFSLGQRPTAVGTTGVNASGEAYGYVDPMLHNPNAAMTGHIPIPIYLRVHPDSPGFDSTMLWLDKLTTCTISELKQIVANKFKDSRVTHIEGIEKAENGQELPYVIEEDHELNAYLTHMQGRKVTFVFLLNQA